MTSRLTASTFFLFLALSHAEPPPPGAVPLPVPKDTSGFVRGCAVTTPVTDIKSIFSTGSAPRQMSAPMVNGLRDIPVAPLDQGTVKVLQTSIQAPPTAVVSEISDQTLVFTEPITISSVPDKRGTNLDMSAGEVLSQGTGVVLEHHRPVIIDTLKSSNLNMSSPESIPDKKPAKVFYSPNR